MTLLRPPTDQRSSPPSRSLSPVRVLPEDPALQEGARFHLPRPRAHQSGVPTLGSLGAFVEGSSLWLEWSVEPGLQEQWTLADACTWAPQPLG